MIAHTNTIKCLIVFIAVLFLFISGCSTPTLAPVEQGVAEKNRKRTISSKSYVIKKGDTLYSIAWKYGLDYKQLAKWNNIRRPYTIYQGQKISLVSHKYSKPIKKNTKKTISNKKIIYKKKNSYKPKKKKVTSKFTKKERLATLSSLKWAWPINGKVIQKFSPKNGKKGIDIAINQKGKNIRAAEAGKVVYSGHGLTGYGLLLIIKHNNNYLSAYAHNSKLLVKEGSNIKKQQVIALSGKSATDRIKLHFEIRYNGKPVDPLRYLPALK